MRSSRHFLEVGRELSNAVVKFVNGDNKCPLKLSPALVGVTAAV